MDRPGHRPLGQHHEWRVCRRQWGYPAVNCGKRGRRASGDRYCRESNDHRGATKRAVGKSGPNPGGGGPPPGGGQTELDGRVSALRGSCPNLTFMLSGSSVYTDGGTQYRGGNCRHMEEGQGVIVAGQRKSDGRVSADRIDLKPKK